MRCSKCGWPNVSGAQTCSKCGATLDGELPLTDNSQDGIKKTVNESDVFGNPQPSQLTACPKCGYPLRPGADKCPNCNNDISSYGRTVNESVSPKPVIQRRPTRLDATGIRGNNFGGTVNPYMVDVEMPPYCSLKPIKRANERHEPVEQEYEGDNIILNRDNTEPGNPSITSKNQAKLVHKDGQWYIEDMSEQHTTFIQASGLVPLNNGDLILLGNRLFEFHD